jgi:hypothetical protein
MEDQSAGHVPDLIKARLPAIVKESLTPPSKVSLFGLHSWPARPRVPEPG